MGTMRVQVRLKRDSGLPADDVMNTTYWQSDSLASAVTPVDADVVADAVEAFYAAIDQTLGVLLTGQGVISVYDMADDEPRVPVLERNMTPLTVAVNALPSEVAMCLSFQAPQISGVNQASRRGRIFLGPLASTWMDQQGDGEVRPSSTLMTTVLNAAAAATGQVAPGDTWRWGVFSPKFFASMGLDFACTPVTEFWMDNAFDTQRRRGALASSRQTVAA